MKKSMLILAASLFFGLASCAPQPNADIFLTSQRIVEGTSSYVELELRTGSEPITDTLLYIGGGSLMAEDARCKPVNNGLGCVLGTVPPETKVKIKITGTDVSGLLKFNMNQAPYVFLRYF